MRIKYAIRCKIYEEKKTHHGIGCWKQKKRETWITICMLNGQKLWVFTELCGAAKVRKGKTQTTKAKKKTITDYS